MAYAPARIIRIKSRSRLPSGLGWWTANANPVVVDDNERTSPVVGWKGAEQTVECVHGGIGIRRPDSQPHNAAVLPKVLKSRVGKVLVEGDDNGAVLAGSAMH